jgi:hypothetical protein
MTQSTILYCIKDFVSMKVINNIFERTICVKYHSVVVSISALCMGDPVFESEPTY